MLHHDYRLIFSADVTVFGEKRCKYKGGLK